MEQQAQGERMAELREKGPGNWSDAEKAEYADIRFGDASLNQLRTVAMANANKLAGDQPLDPQEVARLVADVGIGAAAGFGVGGATDKYSPNAGRVDNMRKFLSSDGFGSQLNGGSRGTPRIYKGSRIFVARKDVGEKIRTGDQFYIDSAHMNHLEVFDNKGRLGSCLIWMAQSMKLKP
ncbi:hypothetical protein QTN24_12750 [Cupriavidus sp. SZY C1]|uniref:hypothetical protein n=1 Tax=Cupriavidus sp. SZY C1 TaxID=3055037 RepID=UPI0028BC2EFB|nr:hypothetical protein [Cupriavidus sp. SZY C1]MDT6962369.1 hypothetical protein [Cupriavidus sp. SZY C1]